MNISDSERIISHLEQSGFKKAPNIEGANLIVIVACSVRQSAIDRIWGLKNKFKKLKAKKILTGCVLKSDTKKFETFFDEILSINKLLGKNYLELRPKHLKLNSAFVPIMTGCDNFCSYCVVPYARGREISRPKENIIKEIKGLINPARRGEQKYKEIILLGQNVNSYKDGKNNFPKLLKIISEIPGDFIIKFLTSHPKDFSDELINIIAKSPKISKEIHLPVQSGDDEILRKMNRGYTAEKYLNLIQKIKEKIPKTKFTTDIIVGFPGETEKQFQNTIKLFKEVKYDSAYINKYSVRPGTIAAKFKDDIPLNEKKRRWRILDKLINNPQKKLPKLIVVLGPTASGKSELAIKIALRLGSRQAEIISADSQQVYKEMDIGTGKIIKKQMKGVSHYMIDIVSPKKQFTITEFREKAFEAIDRIYKRGKTPILCGGTGFYIRTIVDGLVIPEVKPDWKLRKKLEQKTEKELFEQLKKLDPNRAKTIDAKNKHRLIRAIEVILKTGKPIPQIKTSPQYDALYLGVKKPLPELKQKIGQRINKMIKAGLEKEVKNLVKKYGWTKVLKNTIGYSSFAEASKDKREIINDIKLQTYQFAKRQLTWFKKYPGNKIHWISNEKEAGNLIKKFLNT